MIGRRGELPELRPQIYHQHPGVLPLCMETGTHVNVLACRHAPVQTVASAQHGSRLSRQSLERQGQESCHGEEGNSVLPEADDRAVPGILSGALDHHGHLERRGHAPLDREDQADRGRGLRQRQEAQGERGHGDELDPADPEDRPPVRDAGDRPERRPQGQQEHRVRGLGDVGAGLPEEGQGPAEDDVRGAAEGDREPGRGGAGVRVEQDPPQQPAGREALALLPAPVGTRLEDRDAHSPQQEAPHRAVDGDRERALGLRPGRLQPGMGEQRPEQGEGHGGAVAEGAQHQDLAPASPEEVGAAPHCAEQAAQEESQGHVERGEQRHHAARHQLAPRHVRDEGREVERRQEKLHCHLGHLALSNWRYYAAGSHEGPGADHRERDAHCMQRAAEDIAHRSPRWLRWRGRLLQR
mmetsp:Transcript_76524/g.236962  ORF Transcript_76524/g.236962 Transcript_76524/m.236962 type:complete len:411 (+) Transcript_76524:140-1372(+)